MEAWNVATNINNKRNNRQGVPSTSGISRGTDKLSP